MGAKIAIIERMANNGYQLMGRTAEELASIISSFEIIETMLEENNTQISISEEIEQLKALAANPESFDSEQEKKREEAYLKEASDLFAADQMLRDNAHQRRVDLQNQESDDEECQHSEHPLCRRYCGVHIKCAHH